MASTYPIIRLNILNQTIVFQGEEVIEAEAIQEIHPIGIEVPASTARIRVWLDDTTRDSMRVFVAQAGTTDVRKFYQQYTLHDGKPCFKQDVLPPIRPYYIIWVSFYNAWCITSEGADSSDEEIYRGALYSSSDDVATPDLCTTWVIVSGNGGALPLPVVTYRSGGYTMREKFSPFSDGVYYQAMAAGLVVDVSESIDGTEHAIGRFYLEDWNNPKEGELELVCTDVIGTLENKTFLGNFYEVPTLVSKVIGDVLNSAGILYEVDAEIASKLIKGYIPGNISLREALQQVLFAAGAYALSSGDSKLKIKGTVIPESDFASGEIDVTITDGDKTDSQTLSVQPIVTGIDIVSHDYTKGQNVTEEIFSAWLAPGSYMIVYQKPYWHVQAEGVGDSLTYLATTNNEVLVSPDSGSYPDVTIYTIYGVFDFGTNYVYLHVPEPGGIATVTGKPWLDATQVFSWANPNSSSALANIWKIDNATLVPSIQSGEIEGEHETVANVLARVAAYASLRYLQKVTLFPRTDVDMGKIALVDSLYGKDIVGVIEKMSSDLSGGYLIKTEIVGAEHIA